MIGNDSAAIRSNSDFVEPERICIGNPAQGVKDFFRAHTQRFALVLKMNFFLRANLAGLDDFGLGINGHAFAAKNLFELARGVGIKFVQDVRAALDERHFDAESLKKLRELARRCASTENDNRFRQTSEFERGIAIETVGSIYADDGRRSNR